MKNTVILILPKIIICLADLEVVRVRMPFTPESPKLPPFWFYDNTTDTVTGLYRDLLDAVFSSANLTYNLTYFDDHLAFVLVSVVQGEPYLPYEKFKRIFSTGIILLNFS